MRLKEYLTSHLPSDIADLIVRHGRPYELHPLDGHSRHRANGPRNLHFVVHDHETLGPDDLTLNFFSTGSCPGVALHIDVTEQTREPLRRLYVLFLNERAVALERPARRGPRPATLSAERDERLPQDSTGDPIVDESARTFFLDAALALLDRAYVRADALHDWPAAVARHRRGGRRHVTPEEFTAVDSASAS